MFEAVSITDSVPSSELVTYARLPRAPTAIPLGDAPTGTVATMVFVVASSTDTLPSSELVT